MSKTKLYGDRTNGHWEASENGIMANGFVLIKMETFLVEEERILWILESMLTIEAIKCYITERNWRRQWHPAPVLLPGKSHGRRSLVGCSPWGREVGHDWATSLSLFTFMHWRRKWQPTPVFLPGESQGRGAWWAAVYGVAQSQTRLKWLSSSRVD